MNNIDNRTYEQIYALTQMDVNVALVGGEFFTFLGFDPSSSGNTSSIDFVTLTGAICVSEFFKLEKINVVGQNAHFYQQFKTFIEKLQPLTVKFNKNETYFIFSR